jgi:Ca2+-binding RTX toxin-like protein
MPPTPVQWRARQSVASTPEIERHSETIQLANGNILVVFTSFNQSGAGSPAGPDILGRIYDVSGSLLVDTFRLNVSRSVGDEQTPTVTALSNGGFIVGYADYRISGGFPLLTRDQAIHYDVFDANAAWQRGGAIVAPTSGPLTADYVRAPKIVAVSDTSAQMIWTDGEDIFRRFVNPTTGSLGTTGKWLDLNLGGDAIGVKNFDATVLTNGTYALVYALTLDGLNDAIGFQIRTALGSLVSANTYANSTNAENYGAKIAALTNGKFVISWTTDNTGGTNTGIRAQVINPDGSFHTGVLIPPTNVAGNQVHSEVAALDNGEFVVFWFDDPNKDLVGQRFSANGVKVGTEFIILNFNSTNISDISATRLEDGRFAISYSPEYSAAGGGRNVEYAIWDPRDMPNTADPAGNVIGTIFSDSITLSANTQFINGHDGNDTITVGAAALDATTTGLRMVGGTGTDRLTIAGDAGTNVWDFIGKQAFINSFEQLHFNNVGGAGVANRTAILSSQNMASVTSVRFQNALQKTETLEIRLNGNNTVDYSGVTITGFGTLFQNDAIRIIGNNTLESITGTSVSDYIFGAGGNDTLSGFSGDDTLEGGSGADVLNGGGGFDLASYASSNAAVHVSLGAGTALGGHAAGDTFNSIEGLIGSVHADTLVGNMDANLLRGGDGDDFLNGGSGSDTLLGEDGNDILTVQIGTFGTGNILDGGTDTDRLRILNLSPAGFVDLRGETLRSIEEVQFSSNSNRVTTVEFLANQFGGNGLSNTLHVIGQNSIGANDKLIVYLGAVAQSFDMSGWTFSSWNTNPNNIDTIEVYGSTLGDTLIGSSQNDLLDGFWGNDTLMGGAGADTLNGGLGYDEARYTNATSGVALSLAAGFGTIGDANGDVFDRIEAVRGSLFNDTIEGDDGGNILNGDDGADILRGLEGDDTLRGAQGNDTLIGGAGADELNGGSGIDEASYETAPDAVALSLITGGTLGDALGDTFISIESVRGSNFNDTIIGNGAANTLNGLDGHDRIDGGNGDDILRGSVGNDTLIGGAGADNLNGGSGIDEASYETAGSSIALSLVSGGTLGDALGDTFFSIENVRGSNFDDTIIGDGLDNILNGLDGHDRIEGGGGNDTLRGSVGNDTLIGGAGADELNGGSGIDEVSYADAPGVIALSLITGGTLGHALGDTFISIENVRGSNNNDTIIGNGANNILNGLDGDDRLDGGNGDDILRGSVGLDTLIGGAGNDTLNGGSGADVFVFANGFGNDVVESFQNGQDRFDFSLHSATSLAQLTVTNTAGNAVIADGSGNSITVLGAAGLIDASDFIF